MPMTKYSTTTRPPSPSTSSTCFLGCFGCSGDKMQLTDEVNSSRRRRCRWISNWSFGFKKSPTKTFPVDLTTVPWKSKPVNDATPTKKHPMIIDGKHDTVTSGEQKTRRKKWITAVKRQNGSHRRSRQKETKPAATSVTGSGRASPEPKTVTIANRFVSSPLKPLIHSKPVPLIKRQKPPPGAEGGVFRKTSPSGEEFDSIIGMSIMLVILVILVLWGKLCAILCTSAWFFIARRLVAVGEHSTIDAADKTPSELDTKLYLESEEYKKKVILEGFLQRNHRKISGGRL